MKAVAIPEQPGAGRLGRHVEHDQRSRAFALPRRTVRLEKILWRRHGRVFDQGDLGSCTGMATTGALLTEPNYRARHNYREPTAVKIYSLATALDDFPGSYPPEDTGSSGLAACKAAKERGLIREYRWAFGIDQALAALMDGPVITGLEWREGFDRPDASGLVRPTGLVRGGHEFVVRGYDPEGPSGVPEVFCDQSWGDWGPLHGHFRIRVSDWALLLDADGDVTVPVK